MAVAAGTRNLWTGRPPAQGRSAHPHSDQSANVTVDLSSATGKTIQPDLYGYATGALLDNDFQLAANKVVESSAETLSPALIRFNTPVQTIIQSVFAAGASQPDWAPFSRWVQHHGDFLSDPGRLIFGIGPAGNDTSIPPVTWAKYAGATARHFREIGQEITYWEVGNECDPMGAVGYSHYFNAIADALHAVNPGYLVGGPVASWWNGIDLPAFISHSGTKLGFIDFHSYPVNDTDSTQTAYEFASDPGFTMAALWDLVADSNYGAIGNAQDKTSYRAIDEQGWYLRQAAQLMPGQQVLATTTAAELQVLATTSGQSFSVQLVNYQLSQQQSATISVTGGTPSSPITRWALSARYPKGHASTAGSLAGVPLPPQSIVILTGSTTTAGRVIGHRRRSPGGRVGRGGPGAYCPEIQSA
jgi:hypothetical protein